MEEVETGVNDKDKSQKHTNVLLLLKKQVVTGSQILVFLSTET
jgi:hypothetical protein